MYQRLFLLSLIVGCLLAFTTPAFVPPALGASVETKDVVLGKGVEKQPQATAAPHDAQEELGKILPYWSVVPFIVILLAIALIPLIHGHWWESNLNKGVVSILCSLPILAYLIWLGPGEEVLVEILHDYYAFIILLVALFTISGGIHLEGNLRATPLVNIDFLGLGAFLASFIGTTGAAMLLIRPLLNTNQERK